MSDNLALWQAVEKTAPAHVKPITGLLDRIMSYVVPEPNSGCWLWAGSLSPNGYGQVHVTRVDGRQKVGRAHRVLYKIMNGPVSRTLDLDHLCRTRCCVNPDHLEPVSRSENLRRGAGPDLVRRRCRAITHCRQGHPLSGDNLYLTPENKRACKACRLEATRRWKQGRAK